MTDTAAGPQPATEQFGDDYFQDPQAAFARLRAAGPAVPVIMPEGGRAWLVTRYDDVRAALADPRLAKDWVAHMTPDGFDINADPVRAYLNRHLLNMDPPDHTRLRRLVVRAFTWRRVAGPPPRISEIPAGLLDDMAAGPDETDLIESFAFPLPVIV